MLRLAQVAQAVEQANNLPAWLAFFGALIVALLAAATAHHRQRAQLDHDRELHDLGELRCLLDEAAATAYVATNALAEGLDAAAEWFADPDNEGARIRSDEARRAALKARSNLEAMTARIALRRGLGDEVYATYASLMLGCGDIVRALPWKTPPKDSVASLWDARKQLDKIRFAFIDKAQAVVGSNVTKGS